MPHIVGTNVGPTGEDASLLEYHQSRNYNIEAWGRSFRTSYRIRLHSARSAVSTENKHKGGFGISVRPQTHRFGQPFLPGAGGLLPGRNPLARLSHGTPCRYSRRCPINFGQVSARIACRKRMPQIPGCENIDQIPTPSLFKNASSRPAALFLFISP